MKIIIKKDILLENLNNVSKALAAKNLVPALAGIKFDVNKKGLTLTASDNDKIIEAFIPKNDDMDIEDDGTIIIQGKYLIEIIKKIDSEKINIEVFDDIRITISTENSTYDLNGINIKEYPRINLEEVEKPIIIEGKEFKKLVNQTVFATAIDEARPQLTGLNIKITVDELECNATDSYRLARKIIKLNEPSETNYNIIIPGKNAEEFCKIIDDDNVELHIFNNKILVKSGNLKLQSRLINAVYPNTANLLPKESNLKVLVNINDLYKAIDRISVLTSDKEKNIVTLETVGNTLYMRSANTEIGKSEEKMMVTKDVQEDIKISFSAKYMMDALKELSGMNVELSFIGEINPIIIKDDEEENLVQLVLPIRTY